MDFVTALCCKLLLCPLIDDAVLLLTLCALVTEWSGVYILLSREQDRSEQSRLVSCAGVMQTLFILLVMGVGFAWDLHPFLLLRRQGLVGKEMELSDQTDVVMEMFSDN